MTDSDLEKVARINALAKIRAAELDLKKQQKKDSTSRFLGNIEKIGKETYRLQTHMSLFQLAKPIVTGIIIMFLIIGPGFASIMQVVNSMNLWMWVGMIFLIILIWRNR